MPTIVAVPVPEPGYVYIETSFIDVPTATNVCVTRVDNLTGETAPLRAYVSYDASGCLELSCGLGIFWDTEAPLDREVYYCATAGTPAVSICSASVILPSGGCFRFGDPVRPCNDQLVCLSEDDECAPDGGIYFGRFATQQYAAQSGQFLPVNGRRPIVVSRERRDAQSVLTLVTRTFSDEANLLTLNQPGSPLLWRGPVRYDPLHAYKYMSVGDITVDPSFSDLGEEPRIFALPHWTVDSPPGPSQGVCGTRVDDLCDIYPTWNAMVAAGLSYADLLRGKASGDGVLAPLATWNDVNSDFASWNALSAAEANWNDTAGGYP